MIIEYASSTASPIVEGDIGRITLPFISGGEINGSPTFNIFGSLEEQNIIFLSDIAGLLYGVTSNISYFSIISLLMIPGSIYFALENTARTTNEKCRRVSFRK